jgi:eukaryotic-like serine/threonine-protein kinase
MAPTNDCPQPELLHQVLMGRADDTDLATWERHISQCRQCLDRAASFPDDAIVESVRRSARSVDTPEPEVVSTMVSAMRRIASDHSAGTGSWAGPPRAAVVASTAYLSIAETPEELGRLGPYTIHEVLGTGGMGVVYRGFDSRLRRMVAIKVIRPELLANPGMSERFLAEARAAAAVENDHIVAIYAVEEYGGVPCIAMPLLQGESLEKRLKKANGPLPVGETIRLAREIAKGLAGAHAAGMIHRDIKPANLWIERPGNRAKILDFGLALPAETAGSAARFAGTPGYMAPEQARGRTVDARSDLFSLGCVLYHAATGGTPFPAETPIGRIVRTVTFEPIASSAANPLLPAALARLIDELLAKSPENRPESATAVLAKLDAIESEFESRRKRSQRRRLAAAVCAAVVIGGLGAWGAMLAAAPNPEPPVAIAFEVDGDVGPFVVVRDGTEWPVDPQGRPLLELPPGDYSIRIAPARPDRELVPATFIVLPKEPKTVRLALVGEIAASTAHGGAVTGVAIVPNGDRFTVLSSSLDRTLGSWRFDTAERARFAPLPSPATVLTASLDGSLVATTGGNKTAPFDLAIHRFDGRTLAPSGPPLLGHTRRCSTLGVSPDGKRLISAAIGELWLWDTATGTRRELAGHGERTIVNAVAFDPARSQALTGGDDGFAILWDLEEAKPIRKFIAQAVGSNGGLSALAYTTDGFITCGDDGTMRAWNRESFQSRNLATVDATIRCLAISRDGRRLLTGDESGHVRLWSLPDGAPLRAFVGSGKPVRGVAFTPDGRAAASGGEDRTVRLWRLPH